SAVVGHGEIVVEGSQGRDGGLFFGRPEARVGEGFVHGCVVVGDRLHLPVVFLVQSEESVGVPLVAGFFGGRGPGGAGQRPVAVLLGIGQGLGIAAAGGVFGLVEFLELRVFDGRGLGEDGFGEGRFVVLGGLIVVGVEA